MKDLKERFAPNVELQVSKPIAVFYEAIVPDKDFQSTDEFDRTLLDGTLENYATYIKSSNIIELADDGTADDDDDGDNADDDVQEEDGNEQGYPYDKIIGPYGEIFLSDTTLNIIVRSCPLPLPITRLLEKFEEDISNIKGQEEEDSGKGAASLASGEMRAHATDDSTDGDEIDNVEITKKLAELKRKFSKML